MLSKEYIAGFFDGEGCVNIHEGNRGHSLTISIAQKYPYVLGLILVQYPEASLENGSPRSGVFYLRIYGRNAERFLKDILPFVVVKKIQVQLALSFLKILNYENKGRSGKISNEEYVERMKICSALKEDKQNPKIN